MIIFDSIWLKFSLKFDLKKLIGYCVLNLMVSEIFNQLGKDVSGLIGAEKLSILSFGVLERASLKNLLVVVLGLLNVS